MKQEDSFFNHLTPANPERPVSKSRRDIGATIVMPANRYASACLLKGDSETIGNLILLLLVKG
jgi:hypothetical protein